MSEVVTPPTVTPLPCRCGAASSSQHAIVTPDGVQRHIKNLGISPTAGHTWTVYQCQSCGHLDFYLHYLTA